MKFSLKSPSFTKPRSNLTKNQFNSMLDKIRRARNDVAHHKPINYSGSFGRRELVREIELILTHINFNTKDALNNIDNNQDLIRYLQYTKCSHFFNN